MSISTQTGDDGSTSLLFGKRVSKTHPRVEAYGCVDALSAALGLCRAFCPDGSTRAQVLYIQQELIHLMSELACLDTDQPRWMEQYGADALRARSVAHLSQLIREKETRIRFRGWSQSGDTPADAFFDQARTACRQAERTVVALREGGAQVRPELIQYLNRLSDLLWLWGREHAADQRVCPQEGAHS